MIQFTHTVLASPEQMEFIIEGMRNAKDSWDRSDSEYVHDCEVCNWSEDDGIVCKLKYPGCAEHDTFVVGPADLDLMERLKNGGSEHRKFMRMMPVFVRITAPLYWWKEFDTYKIGTVRNSCSTMHTLHKKGVVPDAFSHEWIDQCNDIHLNVSCDSSWDECILSIPSLFELYLRGVEQLRLKFNETHEKKYWYAMIQMLPDSFMMTANVMCNYEVVYNQKHQRGHHKQDEWRVDYMKWINELPYQWLLDIPDASAAKES